MGELVDMTGRVLEAGETVTLTAGEQATNAQFEQLWRETPDIVREIAKREDLFYPHVVEIIVHSLLQEAVQAAASGHEPAVEVLEFIERKFFTLPDDSTDSSPSS
jgi:hypothetical protein